MLIRHPKNTSKLPFTENNKKIWLVLLLYTRVTLLALVVHDAV